MASENGSTVDAQLDASGSSEPCGSPQSVAEQSLLAEIRALVRSMAETNAHLLVLADQTARCLSHISILLDLLLTSEQDADAEAPTSYLDGTPIL